MTRRVDFARSAADLQRVTQLIVDYYYNLVLNNNLNKTLINITLIRIQMSKSVWVYLINVKIRF
jgi:hypothetical protein